jgi:primosomal protein N''
MATPELLANLSARLDHATTQVTRMRQAGSQEQYLQAYFLAEALDLQLSTLTAGNAAATGAA